MYGPVPPVGTAVALPLPPLHNAGVTFTLPVMPVVDVTLMVFVCVHPLASVTVQVHTPGARPVMVAVPSPDGLPGDQLYV